MVPLRVSCDFLMDRIDPQGTSDQIVTSIYPFKVEYLLRLKDKYVG